MGIELLWEKMQIAMIKSNKSRQNIFMEKQKNIRVLLTLQILNFNFHDSQINCLVLRGM